MPEMFIDVEAAPRGEGGAAMPTVQNWASTEKPTTAVPVTASKDAIMDVIIDGRRYIPADGLDSAAYLQKVEKKKKMRKVRRCGLFFLLLVLIVLAFVSFGHRMGHKGRSGHKGGKDGDDEEDSHHGHKGGKKHGGRGGKHGRHGLGWRHMKDEPEADPTDLRYALEDQVHDQELDNIQEEAGEVEAPVSAPVVHEDTPQSGKATIQGKKGGQKSGKGGKKGGKKGGRRGERKTVEEICTEMTEKGEPEKKNEDESQAVTDARLKVWNLKKQIACEAAAAEDNQKDADLVAQLKAAFKEFREAKKADREAADSSN